MIPDSANNALLTQIRADVIKIRCATCKAARRMNQPDRIGQIGIEMQTDRIPASQTIWPVEISCLQIIKPGIAG